MGPLNNIGNFFRKRLIETNAVEQEWNIPSDDIWMAAKPHFPQEKPRRRPFIIFLFLGALIISSVVMFYPKLKSINKKESQKGYIVNNTDSYNTPTEKSSQLKIPEKSTVAIHNKLSIDANKVGRTKKLNKNTPEKNTKAVSSFKETKTNKQTNITNQNSLQKQNTPDELAVNEKELATKFNLLKKDPTDNNETNNSEQSIIKYDRPGNQITTDKIGTLKINRRVILNLLTLPFNEIAKLPKTSTSLLTQTPGLIEIQKNQRKNRWEVGLALSQFNKKPEWIIKELLDEDDMYTLQSKQIGFNVSVSKLVSDRFSFTTGIIFSQMNFDLTIMDTQIFGEEVTIDILKKRIQDFVTLGNLSVNGNGRDINVIFLDENDLSKGDILNLKAEFPIRAQLYQLPFIINYRLIKQKWEWIASAGISIDLANVHLNNVKVDVLKDGISTIKPVEVDPISDISLAGSLYVGAGIKYELRPTLSLGLLSRIDITDLRLSKYDIGIYYKL